MQQTFSAFLISLTILSGNLAVAAPPEPLRALLITGGCCHDYPVQKEILKKGLEQRAYIDVEVVFQGGKTTDTKIELYEDPNWAEGFDVVLHDECFAAVKDNAWTQRILKPHREGIPAVVLHCAMHCYRDGTTDWFEFCGVTSHRHGKAYPHEVLNRDAEHPVMQGWGAGWANPAGELYWIEKVWPTAHPLCGARNQEKGNEEVCVWTNEYGPNKTRVFGSTLGHHNVTVEDPKFLDLVTRGTLWACGKLNDEYLKPVVAQRVPVNLAKDAVVTVSSEETNKNNLAAHANDGNGATRWCASNGGFPQSLRLDLGSSRTVTGVGLKWENSSAAYSYRLEGSRDGENWEMLADRSGANQHFSQESLTPADWRYLRLTVLGSNTGSWASLFEVEVHGTETVELASGAAQEVVEREFLKDVKIPAGFEATLFAAPPAVQYPVYVAAAPEGIAYVSVDRNGSLDRSPLRGSVVRLRDVDGDGRADESKLFVPNVDSPRGLVWDRDRLYLMHPPHLSAFIDHDADGIADEQQILVKNIAFGFADRPADHTSNGVTLGIDGWLYLAIGDFGFMDAEGTDGRKLQLRGGGVVRVRPDGSGLEIFSRGTRNILEVAVDPLLNGFTRDNTNDGDGWDIRLHHFTGLEHHGYPSFYKNFSDEMVAPLADYGGGSGCGALFLSEPGFPEGYGNALYTADWGRNWIYRHQLSPTGATFSPDQHEFLGATRVTDLDVDASSRLFVTSWKGATFTYAGEDVGYLVQLRPQGYQAPPLPDYAHQSPRELVDGLKSPSHRRRLAAQRELIGRQLVDDSEGELQQVVFDSTLVLDSRVAGLFALAIGRSSSLPAVLNRALADTELAPFVIRLWGESTENYSEISPGRIGEFVLSQHPRTSLEAMVALARRGATDQAKTIAQRLTDSDPVLSHTALQTFGQLRDVDTAFRLIQSNADPAQRERVLVAVRQWHDSAVVSKLLDLLDGETDSTRRRGLLTALCRLYYLEGAWQGNSWGTRPDTSGPYYQHEKWSETDRIDMALQRALELAQGEAAADLFAAMALHKIPLESGLDRLLKMAADDHSLRPIAVAELSRLNEIPGGSVPLLMEVARSTNSAHEIRELACIALLRSRNSEAFPVVLAGFIELTNSSQRKLDKLWSVYLNGELLAGHLDQLRSRALDLSAPEAVYAEAGLLALASPRSGANPLIKAAASDAMNDGWRQTERRHRQLEALKISNQREYADRVLASINDEDPQVAKLARELARQWKLELSPTPRGPQLKTMSAEAAIVEVQKLPGQRGQGEAIYAKLNCSKCHTVRKGEPLRGPFLPNVAKTYSRLQLAESIVVPSKSLAQGFVTYTFVMNAGKSHTGFITNEAADVVTLRDAEGRELQLPVSEIDERVKQSVSVMPEGLVKELTIEEFASLLAYLESLAGE